MRRKFLCQGCSQTVVHWCCSLQKIRKSLHVTLQQQSIPPTWRRFYFRQNDVTVTRYFQDCDRVCRTSSASKRATVSTWSILSTVSALQSIDSSPTSTPSVVLRSKRTCADHWAERRAKFRASLLARSVTTLRFKSREQKKTLKILK